MFLAAAASRNLADAVLSGGTAGIYLGSHQSLRSRSDPVQHCRDSFRSQASAAEDDHWM